MRQIALPGTNLRASVVGMGCASLGSRYDARTGLRVLDAAFERGVTWFDVAPAYGAGDAESILAQFLKTRRAQVNICTKIGLAAPRHGFVKKLLMPLARPTIARLKGLRSKIRETGATANVRVPLTATVIEESVARSLARLGTDHVEVFALHDPSTEEVRNEEVLRALERVVARGQARYVAVAGELDAAIAGAAIGGFPIIQTADDPATEPLDHVRAAAIGPIATISHSVFGGGKARLQLAKRLLERPEALSHPRALGFVGDNSAIAAQLLLARSLAANGGGPTLVSMFGKTHLASNIAAAELNAPTCEAARVLVRHCLGKSPAIG